MGNTRNPEEPNQSEKRTKLEDSWFPISKLTTAAVIKTVWYWHKDRYIDEWNRCKCSFMANRFYNVPDNSVGKKSLFNKWCWDSRTFTRKTYPGEHIQKTYPYFTSSTKKYKKENQRLNVRAKTIQ